MHVGDRKRVAVEHGEAREELEQIKDRLANYLRTTCDNLGSKTDVDFRFRWVAESRVKGLVRLIDALDRGRLGPANIWEIDDIVGARVVVVTKSDARLLAEAIAVDPSAPLTRVSVHHIDQDDTGYRAIHVKGWRRTTFGEVGCEVQIRTMLEDAWAIVSRHDLYGLKEVPESLRGIAIAESGHLAAAEESLERIRKHGVGGRFVVGRRELKRGVEQAERRSQFAMRSAYKMGPWAQRVGVPGPAAGKRRRSGKAAPKAVHYLSCFISYGRPDADFARRLQSDLKDAGVSCWMYDMDKSIGAPVWREVEAAIQQSEITIVICSASALVRQSVVKEIEGRFDTAPDTIVPISLDDVWRSPGFSVSRAGRDMKSLLLERTRADFANAPYQQALRNLLKSLRRPE
jgi:ppGpp synthetase/RelA/SpoT-type nucleotidyltranferase